MTDPFAPPSGDQPTQAFTTPPPVYGAPQPPPPYGGAPVYGAPPPYGAPLQGQANNGLGTAALVVGIASIVLSFTVVGGFVLGILGIIFGLIGRGRVKRAEANNGGVALAGVITGGIGIVIAGLAVLALVLFFNSDSGHKLRDCLTAAGGDTVAQQQCNTDFANDLQN